MVSVALVWVSHGDNIDHTCQLQTNLQIYIGHGFEFLDTFTNSESEFSDPLQLMV